MTLRAAILVFVIVASLLWLAIGYLDRHFCPPLAALFAECG